MNQTHTQLTVEQVKVLLEEYRWGLLNRSAMDEVLDIGRSRFFVLLNEHHGDPERFPITYPRESRPRLPASVEAEIEKELRTLRHASPPEYRPYHRRPGLRVFPVELSTGPATIAVDLPPDRRARP